MQPIETMGFFMISYFFGAMESHHDSAVLQRGAPRLGEHGKTEYTTGKSQEEN